jgi:hypothetical protein
VKTEIGWISKTPEQKQKTNDPADASKKPERKNGANDYKCSKQREESPSRKSQNQTFHGQMAMKF